MVYGYARVSTKGQAKDGNSLEAQERVLRENGAEEIYFDSFTGTKLNRPQFNLLCGKLSEGDVLIVTKLDRFARSASQGIELIEQLVGRGVKVNVLNMGILDSSPSGRLIRNVMLCFAEFERDMIIQRTSEGKAVAKEKAGYREGRIPTYTEDRLEHAVSLLDQHSYREVEHLTGISKSTLIRAKRKLSLKTHTDSE